MDTKSKRDDDEDNSLINWEEPRMIRNRTVNRDSLAGFCTSNEAGVVTGAV